MPQKTNIEWTDYSSNPIYAVHKKTGKRGWFCEKISPGCGHCYACQLNRGRFGNGLDFVPMNADKIDFVLNEKELFDIIRLNDRLAKRNERAKLFPFDMTDLFLSHHPDEYIDKFFAVAALCPNIDFQVLTKRPLRMREYFCNPQYWPLPNVWLGVSVEDQQRAGERIPLLLQTPAAVRFLSVEPMLASVDLGRRKCGSGWDEWLTGRMHRRQSVWSGEPKIDWVIVGGESGGSNVARSFNIEWARSIVAQCKEAEVPVFVKQLGTNPFEPSRYQKFGDAGLNLKDRKGGDPSEWPEDLRDVREFPKQFSAVGSL